MAPVPAAAGPSFATRAGGLLMAVVGIAAILFATGVFKSNDPPPSPAFQTGYQIGQTAGALGSSGDCASAVRFAGSLSAAEQRDWIGGCRAGAATARP